MNWETFASQFGIAALLLGAVVWLSKIIITTWIGKEFEAYKQKLAYENEMNLEKMRYDFQRAAIEHEVKYRSIHEKQAEIIGETYEKLQDLYSKEESYTAVLESGGEPTKEEKRRQLIESNDKFRFYFFPKQIYFPSETRNKVKEFYRGITEKSEIFTLSRQGDIPPTEYFKFHKKFTEEIRPLFTLLEDDFQKLLGVPLTTGAKDAPKK
jgi:hypothetical protein